MVYPYIILYPNHPVKIESHQYLHLFINAHHISYRLKLKHRHYYTIFQYRILRQTAVDISWCVRDDSHRYPQQNPPTWRCNRLLFIPLCKYIVHWYRYLLDIRYRTIIMHLTKILMTTVGARFTEWWPLSPAWNPIPYNLSFLVILGSLNRCHFWSFGPLYHRQ